MDDEKVDPDICPECHQPNGCEKHCGGPDKDSCWCHKLLIPKGALDGVSTEEACLCRVCLIKRGAKELPLKVL